jgi:NifB/MoaA-like Fe-S oxidoreductase
MTHCNECGDLIPIRCYCHTCYVQLQAENARFREALEKIAQQQIGEDVDDPYPEWEYAYEQVVKVARAALGKE